MSVDHHGEIVLALGDLHAISCTKCNFIHRHPLPPPQEQAEAYRDIYGRGQADLLEQRAGDQWYWRLVYRERMREFERLTFEARFGSLDKFEGPMMAYSTENPYGRPMKWRLLDYGAGLGWFVKWAREASEWWWDISGYEPVQCQYVTEGVVSELKWEKAARHPNMLKVMDIAGMKPRYHAIHCSMVLEHVYDPAATLAQMHDLLLDKGTLCITVPNEFNPLQLRLTKRWHYSPFAQIHLNYFTSHTLRAVVEQAGFEVLYTEATFPMEWFALHTPLNYVKHPKLGRWAHRLRMLFEAALLAIAPEAKRRMYRKWGEAGIGREVAVWARKSD